MNKCVRFSRFVVWGNIILLPLVFMACPLPAGPDGTKPGPAPQEMAEGAEDENNGEDPGEGSETGHALLPGELHIRIGETEKPKEGVCPDLSGVTRFRLDFSGEGGRIAESRYLEAEEELVLSLEPGLWEIRASGLLDREAEDPPLAVICGSAQAWVPEGGTETVLIVPGPAAGSGEPGFLSWNIEYPEEKVWGAALAVSLKINEDTAIPYTVFDIRGAGAAQKISLPPGTYRMEARFLSHTEETGSTELVHIYPGLETGSTPVNIPETAFQDPREFSSTADLKAYLDSFPENTGDTPYPVKIGGVDISSGEKTGETLKTLYEAIEGRYVSLDLRECTGTNLLPASTARLSNRANVVALILPDSITNIGSNGFSGYTGLKSAVLPKVGVLNTSAFKNCGILESVFAPELETINGANDNAAGAFTGCTALKTLYAPRLENLGKYALYGCHSFTEAAFPKLRPLGGLAFKKCTALKALSLPSVTRIDSGSFEEAAALKYLVFGLNPPELGTNIFKGAGFPQAGVIYIPQDAVDTYKNTSLPNWSGLKELIRPLPVPAAP
ncbi:MAG: leucine-rich repeat domain-containing protein [Treponema sp.]|nr:leucine-rich repeat domain-containing protein [Treponema sp.]